MLSAFYCLETPRLQTEVFGLKFPAPLGVAAGFDKNGAIFDLISSLGFGFAEIGSVSHKPCAGNPKPRLLRVPDERALVNRMGLNNVGYEGVLTNLSAQSLPVPIGISLVKTNDPSITGDDAIIDFVECFAHMSPAASFIVLNLSCPNTEDGRTFEEPELLRILLKGIFKKRDEQLLDTPVLLKFSPDLSESEIEGLFKVSEDFEVEGYVLSNTILRKPGMCAGAPEMQGGISGRPLKQGTLERIRFARKVLPAKRVIVACGGVESGADMFQLMKAGASLVELYSALIYEGPGICQKILLELLRLLDREGISKASEIVGADNR